MPVFKLHFDHGPPVKVNAANVEEAREKGARLAQKESTRLRKVKLNREK